MLTVPGKIRFQDPVIFNPRVKTLTDAAIDLFTLTLADGDIVGGMMMGLVRVNDGTDRQGNMVLTTWAAVRKANTVTATHTYVAGNQALANSAGTFTMTATAVDSGSGVATFRITPAGSLTETTYDFAYVVFPMRGTVVYL